MNKIETKILRGELKYHNTVVLTYKITYPEITSPNCFGIDIFNRYNKNKALKLEKYTKEVLYKDAVDLYKYNTANGYPIMEYEVYSEFEITYNKNDLISLYYDQYIFSGGAHGNTIRSSQTWNLCTRRTTRFMLFLS